MTTPTGEDFQAAIRLLVRSMREDVADLRRVIESQGRLGPLPKSSQWLDFALSDVETVICRFDRFASQEGRAR